MKSAYLKLLGLLAGAGRGLGRRISCGFLSISEASPPKKILSHGGKEGEGAVARPETLLIAEPAR